MSREAFEKWWSDPKTNRRLTDMNEGRALYLWKAGWQAALKSVEPVARVIDDGTPEGATEWIPFCNRTIPLKTGDLLYTTPQPLVDTVAVIDYLKTAQNNCALNFSVSAERCIKRAIGLLSAGKGGE